MCNHRRHPYAWVTCQLSKPIISNICQHVIKDSLNLWHTQNSFSQEAENHAVLHWFVVEENKMRNAHYLEGRMCMDWPGHSSVLHPTPILPGSSLKKKFKSIFSLVVEQCTQWLISCEPYEARHRILSESSGINYQMAAYPEMVYVNHSNVSGKALVTWAGLVAMGQHDQEDV